MGNVYVLLCDKLLSRKLVQDYGLWNQLRVDKGREWFLMQKLGQYRNDTSKPSFLQTPSKQVYGTCALIDIICAI